ncbi:MAG: ABC-2 type transport system permease protein [Verrucomicrobiales bacterium]|jgi:ABC-2 type transport system permease protein
MRTFYILFVKELRSFFVSPLAWVVMALVMVLSGIAFTFSLEGMSGKVNSVSLIYYTFNSNSFWMVYFVIFPLITMRLFAEEKKLGTLESLMTAPISTASVLAAKYVAALVFYCIVWLPSLLNFLLFEMISGSEGAFTGGALFGAYLILFLLGLFNVAIGCFASSLTSNQIIAGVAGFCLVMLHFFIGYIPELIEDPDFKAAAIQKIGYVSTIYHLRYFTQGLIDTRVIVYYSSFALLFFLLTYYVLEFRRWRA